MGEISYIRGSFQLDETSVVMRFLLAGWTLIPRAKEESVELVRSYLAKRNTIKAHLSKPNGASSRGGHLRCREPRLAASSGSTGFLYQSGHAKKRPWLPVSTQCGTPAMTTSQWLQKKGRAGVTRACDREHAARGVGVGYSAADKEAR